MSLGARIVDARKARGMEQKDVSDQIDGLSQQALSNLERRDSATSEYAIRIADVLRVSVRWLLDGEGAMYDTDWPFPAVDRQRWVRLGPSDREFVQRWTNMAIKECEDVAEAVAAESQATEQEPHRARNHAVHQPSRPPYHAPEPASTAAKVTHLVPPHKDTGLKKTRAQKDRARHVTQRKRGQP